MHLLLNYCQDNLFVKSRAAVFCWWYRAGLSAAIGKAAL
jgi:hypothetical protein